MARAAQAPAVINALGQPITTGYLITGNINTSGDGGRARLVIPLLGPKGSASLHLRATRQGSIWTFSLLTVDIPSTHQHVDLLPTQANLPANPSE